MNDFPAISDYELTDNDHERQVRIATHEPRDREAELRWLNTHIGVITQ